MQARLTYSQHARATLRLGLPLVGSHVAQMAIILSDAVMLGWYSVEALAAEVLGGTLYYTLFLVGSGFAWAVMPMVAAAEANGDERQIRRVARMGGWASMMFAVLALPIMFWAEPLFLMAGQEPDVSALAGDYAELVGIALFPSLMVMVLKSYLAALERTQIVLWVTVGAVGVNILVNYLFIFGNWGMPEMGVRGAALASLVTTSLSFVILAIYAAKAEPEHALFTRVWRPDWEALGQVFRLGWPIGMTSLAETGLFAASTVMMGWLGTIALAAHGIAMQVASVTFMVHLGLSNAATVRAGQAFGRGDGPGLRDGAKVVLGLSAVFALVTVIIMLVWPETLISLFLDPEEPDRAAVIGVGVGLLAAAALFQFMDAGQVMALGLLRGVQDTRAPMIIATISYWIIGVPVSYVFGFTLGGGGVGIWLGLAVGLALAAVLLLIRFWGWSGRNVGVRALQESREGAN